MSKALTIAFVVIASCSAWAAGGACPTASTYMEPIYGNSTGTLAGFGITSCFYVDFVGGADTNSGTSEASPWKHAPKMVGCASTCLSTAVTGGEGFILKGGVTWDSTVQQWVWSVSGSVGNPIYIGYDATWFTGGSWTRPILSCSNTCWQQLSITGTFVDIDNVEFTGLFNNQNPPSPAVSAISVGSGNRDLHLYNLYFHGSNVAHDGAHDSHYISWSVVGNDSTSTTHHNVFDNSDAQVNGVPCNFVSGTCTMTAQEGGPRQIFMNYYSHFGGSTLVIDNPIDFHNNIVEWQVLSPDNGVDHENMFESNGETGSGAVLYNNVVRHGYNCGVVDFQLGPNTGITSYAFNNVLPDMDGCNMQQTYEGSSSLGTVWWFNNTAEAGLDSGTPAGNCGRSTSALNVTKVINQHCIGTQTGTAWWNGAANATFTTNLPQSKASAAGQGYTNSQTYSFSPTLITNSTVGAGTNEVTLCTAISSGATTNATVNSNAGIACHSDTSYGVTYNTGNHSITGVGRLAVARPLSAAWDIGAFQFVLAPISQTIKGVVQISGSAVMK